MKGGGASQARLIAARAFLITTGINSIKESRPRQVVYSRDRMKLCTAFSYRSIVLRRTLISEIYKNQAPRRYIYLVSTKTPPARQNMPRKKYTVHILSVTLLSFDGRVKMFELFKIKMAIAAEGPGRLQFSDFPHSPFSLLKASPSKSGLKGSSALVYRSTAPEPGLCISQAPG